MTRQEAARIAAVLPLPKARGAVAPKGFTRRYGSTIAARIGVVARDGLDACVYRDIAPPEDRAPPRSSTPDALPGEEYETARPLPPLEEAIEELPASEPSLEAQENAGEPAAPQEMEATPEPLQPIDAPAPSPPPEPAPATPPGL